MTEPKPLADAIEEFLDQHDMSPITFGRKALNDPHFVRDITDREKPRRVWPETEGKVRAFMSTYDPQAQEAA